jgi:hypothetical protein
MKRIEVLIALSIASACACAQPALHSAMTASSMPPSNGASHSEVSGDTLWFGTGKGITRSVDHGVTWETFPDKDFEQPGVASIAVLDDRIWAGTVFEKNTGDGSVQTGSGYTLSNDRGATWTHLPQVVDNSSDSIISYGINDSIRILPVTVPEQNISWGVSLSPNTVWIASWASGLRKSTDNGQHWERILLPADDQNSLRPTDTLWTSTTDGMATIRNFRSYDPRENNNMLAFSVLAVDPDTIWCGTAGGLNKSTDGGVSWIKFTHQNQSSPILGNWIICIREQRLKNKSRIWITNWRASDATEEYGVSYSDDGGASWINLLHGIRAYDFAFRDSIVYVATEQGLYRSADDGKTWIRNGSIIDNALMQRIATPIVHTVRTVGSTVWAGTPDGIASTPDDADHPFGLQWTVSRTYTRLGSTAAAYAYPNPFSPAQNPIRIHYSTGGTAERISIEIFDFGMNHVRTLLRNADRDGTKEYEEFWNGLDESARRISNGVYFYRISLGDNNVLWGKILVVQ